MHSKNLLIVFAVIFILTLALPVFAQKETGVILGTISDAEGQPLPGVTITVSSDAIIGGHQVAYTEKEGHYRFPALPPGYYDIKAELQGYQQVVRKGVRLYVGNSYTVDLSLEPQRVSESIEVTGAAPLIDATTAATSTTIPVEAVENLPKLNFALDLVTLTPGVNGGRDDVESYVAYGAGGSSANSYWLDGVDVSDPEGSTPWVFPNYNWLQEVQVVGIGAPAEYGGFTGVVTNSVTRSGGNDFHGLFETFYQNDSLTGINTGSLSQDLQDSLTPPTEKLFSDSTIQVGGPIRRDKFWFFTSFQYFKEETKPLGFLGTHKEKSPRIFGKFTYKLNENNTLQGFSEWDRYDIDGRDGDTEHPTSDVTLLERAPEYSWNATWISLLNPETVLDARFSGFWGYYYLTPDNDHPNVPSHFDGATSIWTVNNHDTYLADRQRYQLNVSVSHYARDFIKGDHDFKFGMEFERSGVQSRYYYNGGIYYYDYSGQPSYRYLYTGYNINTPLHRTSAYAQDSWNIAKKLNLNIGVRWDHNRGIVKELGTVFRTDPVAPRLGLTFDVKGNQKTVIKAHYGRYYEGMFSDYFSQVSPKWSGYRAQYFDFDSGEWVDVSFTPHDYAIDPNIKQPFVDQFTVGVDQELPGDIAFSAHYIHRKYKNFIDDGILPNTIFEPFVYPTPNPVTGDPITVFNEVNPGEEKFLLKNQPTLFRRYNAIELIGNKRLSKKFYLSASLVIERTKGNTDNGGYTSSGSNTGIYSKLFNDPNFNINIDGRPTFDPATEIKMGGIYHFPYGINISGGFTHLTGDTWTPRFKVRGVNQAYTPRVFAVARGTNRLPSRNVINLRLEKTFPVSRGQLRFTADMFNLFNTGYPLQVENTVDQGNFSEPTDFSQPRAIRLGLRYTF